MDHKLLGIYLNDHLAAATGARDLAARSLGANRATDYGAFLEELLGEIEEDREVLVALMRRLDIGEDRLKQVGAWAIEKAGRLKLNGSLTGYSPLSRVVELEALVVGVSGKLSLWTVLSELADTEPALGELPLERLRERAQRQLDGLGAQRNRAAREALVG